MSVNLYKLFETNEQFEKEGIWYDFGEDTKFRLARAGGQNMRFAKVLEAKTRPHRRQIANDTMDPELAMKLMVEAFVDTVLLDWQGVTDKEGNILEYSRANAIKLLTDLPDLFTELRTESQRISNFRDEQLEDDSGN